MWLISSIRVPVVRLRMEIGRGGREMRGMTESEEAPGGLHRGASPQVLTLQLPTESGTGQSRPSLTLPHGSSSLVSVQLNCADIAIFSFFLEYLHQMWFFQKQIWMHNFREHVASCNFSGREGEEGEHASPPRSSCQRIVLWPHSPSWPIQNFHITGEKTRTALVCLCDTHCINRQGLTVLEVDNASNDPTVEG